MCLRTGLLWLMISLACAVQAQQDSIVLNEVIVHGIPEYKFLAGSRIVKLDSTLSTTYKGNSLNEALSFQLPVYFRNYGSGMLSGISMRGTGTSHTAVLWNGININSFSLGQADFSILPAVAFDEVSLHEGAGSASFGSGAFGGAVLLQTIPDKKPLFHFRQEAASFGRLSSAGTLTLSNQAITFSTSGYRQQAQNNFIIQRTGERQTHTAYLQQGIVQTVSYGISDTRFIQLDYWFHEADRQIQPTINAVNTSDEQQDRNHRLSLSYNQSTQRSFLKAGGGIVDDEIVYNGSSSTILRWLAFARHQHRFDNGLSIQFGADWNHIIGKIKEYGHTPIEDRVDLFASLQKQFKRVSISANFRKPFISGIETLLLPYLGTDVIIVETDRQRLNFSINVSRNFRAPTFNDRYWENSGKRDLLPEKSYAAENSLSWRYNQINVRATCFYQFVDQWIQWKPDEGGVYRPENIRKVAASGLESSAEARLRLGNMNLVFTISHQLTRSIVRDASQADSETIGKQLTYTPRHTAVAGINAAYKGWSLNVFNQFSGVRFTEDTNLELYALDAYVLTDLAFGKVIFQKRHILHAQFLIRNLLGTDYQQYAARAMPGRNYSISITYRFINKPNKQ